MAAGNGVPMDTLGFCETEHQPVTLIGNSAGDSQGGHMRTSTVVFDSFYIFLLLMIVVVLTILLL
jgi:hypothetical protein